MKILFDHINGFGKISDYEVIVNCAYGIADENDHISELLNQGWIPWKNRWYNERSTRINLEKYKPSKTTKRISHKIKIQTGDISKNLEVYKKIHEKYCEYNFFKREIDLETFLDCNVIEYWTDRLVAISIYKLFDNQMVAYQFIWDYEDPKLSMGNVAQMFECQIAKENKSEYVYLLGGYEKCCEYKSNYSGFEFWTGLEWSTDIELYKKLVLRDDQIRIENI